MAFEPNDVLADLEDRLYTQYKDSENFKLYLEVLLTPFQELEEVFADILNLRELDNATDAQLDVNGALVVQDRPLYDSNTALFFGMDPVDDLPVAHLGFSDLDDPSVIGGILRSINQPTAGMSPVTDDEYRKFIYLKAQKNRFKGGYEALIRAVETIIDLETGDLEITEDFTTADDPFVLLDFKISLTDLQKEYLTVLDPLPRGGGIRFEYSDLDGPL